MHRPPHFENRQMGHRQAFTLIELLVFSAVAGVGQGEGKGQANLVRLI
jgi:hypothetical protein